MRRTMPHFLTALALTPLAASALALGQSAGERTVDPAPNTAAEVGVGGESAQEDRIDPAGGEVLDRAICGERVPMGAIGPVRIESMEAVLLREAEFVQDPMNRRTRNGRQGEWQTPNPKIKFYPHSGEKCVLNRWGDTSMGIGFGAPVDVDEVWVAAQGGEGIWAEAVRVAGFRDGELVAVTDWFADVDRTPSRFAVGLVGVDRIVVEAKPSVTGAGFYALDDLAYTDGAGASQLVDFEDAVWDSRLTDTGYSGLVWEIGTGTFTPPGPRIVPAPQTLDAPMPGSAAGAGGGAGGTTMSSSRGGSGTAPTFLQDFRGPRFGDTGANSVPPDTCGAVGLNHYVAAVNSNLSVYDKTGTRVLNTSLQSFWGTSVGDPRIAYDFANDRWVAIATPFDNRIFLAYSLTSDPTGAWFKTSFNAAQGSDAGRWVDYPTLGVDSRGLFIAAFMVGNPARMTIFAIDKAPLLNTPPTLGTVTAFRNLTFNGAIQHANQYTDAGTSYMVSTRATGTLRLRTVAPPMTNPTLTTNNISGAGAYSNPPDAPAMGSTVNIDTGDTRLMNACYVDGSIWTSHCVSSGGRAAVKWYEIDPVTRLVLQSGIVDDPSLHYYYPSVAADDRGNVVMGFSGSNSTTFPSAYYTGRVGSDTAGQMAPPVLYSAGLASYTVTDGFGRNRWGDYSLTSLDPVDGTFWTIQERTRNMPNRWVTQIAQVEHDTCGLITRYCTAIQNPSGFTASIDTSGSTSLAANDLTLSCFSLPGQTFGIFFFGQNQTFTPVGDGNLCINNPFFRLAPVQSSIFGIATLPFDSANLPPGYPTIMPGEVWNFSFWYRQVSPAGSNFSDAVGVEFCD